ncbi:zinc ribbon domain-containing protein [Methanoregula sp.]|uniref:zinc ribbon domain-containing protein n=1 Tax=Methanoregula sp. TaxID=2052170 RepID=UPI002C705157|nr:zinc ribbon domain-containing protein [Methanoregula sp.]HVP95858.1 zinc ribbon domain-containing protein [Methanoregula sp.]
MGYPDLKSDESIVLTAQHVKVKSVPFELVLTNRRLIIIDSEKNVVPTQQIQLFTIRNVMASENAIRDPVITLTILTDTADTREMALTFVRQTAGERRREADEWTKALRKNIAEAAAFAVEASSDTPTAAGSHQDHAAGGIKKKIEGAGPIKKITVETGHLPPKPVETTSLPEGSFCGRCGNRIPPGSTFCNRCGTKVPGSSEEAPPAAPQIATAPAAPHLPGERRVGRPIEQIIHSIEPLIADSVPRAESAPVVPSPTAPPAEPAPAPAVPPAAESPAPADAPAPAAAPLPDTFAATLPPMPPIPPIPPVPEAPKKKSRKILAAAIIIVIILAIVAGGFVVMNLQKTTVVQPVTTPVPTTAVPTPTPTPTPAVTAVVTTVAVTTTPQSLIPQSGVWAEITYDKTYSGLVGIPGSQAAVSDTGDHFYRIPTVDGSVAISVQKTDGSGDQLTVTLYKDGSMVKTVSTTTPNGSVDLQITLATPTATPTPVLTPMPTLPISNTTTSLNKTGNTT